MFRKPPKCSPATNTPPLMVAPCFEALGHFFGNKVVKVTNERANADPKGRLLRQVHGSNYKLNVGIRHLVT